MANDVTYTREEYDKEVATWSLVEDVCEGQRKVKAGRKKYLPDVSPTDMSIGEQAIYYENFLKRAVFYNVTGRTLEGLVGTVFKKDPVLEVPPRLEFVQDDIDGHGVSIQQQSQEVVANVLKKGRNALYVDYPPINQTLKRRDQDETKLRAFTASVDADQVTNWRVENVNGVYKLTLVVIKEQHEKVTEDGFGLEKEDQYRVLKLVENVYQMEIWRKIDSKWTIVESLFPVRGDGTNWDVIPFIFVGAENNDSRIDKSPLLDLANLNIAHYQNSALYEDSIFLVGQPQPYMTGLNEEWRDRYFEQGVIIGSRSVLPLPENGSFGFAQVTPNTLVKEAMDKKEEQMIALGARVIEKGGAVKTATEAQNENESQHSVLSLVAVNVSEAYTQCLIWMAEFMLLPTDVNFELNQDFMDVRLDAQMLTALVSAWQQGRLPNSDFWAQMRKYGLIDPEKSDEDIQDEIDNDPSGLALEPLNPLNLEDDDDDESDAA